MFGEVVLYRSNTNTPRLSDLFFTFSSHMNEALYGPQGYYTQGTPFAGNTHDFTTHATKGQGMGFIIAAYLEQVYSAQREQSRDNTKTFSAVELSGGDGSLAFSILSIIETLAEKNYRNFRALWKDLKYTTYEISETLTHQQRTKNAKWITNGKYNIINQSAENLPVNEPIDFLFSNEFWDALGLDAIKKQSDGSIKIQLCLPYLPHEKYDTLDETMRLENESHIRMLESKIGIKLPIVDSKRPIDIPVFRALNKNHHFCETIHWETLWMNLDHIPELKAIFSIAQVYLDELDAGYVHYISPLAIKMMDLHAKINPYFTLHFDYAAAYKGGNRGVLRAYPKENNSTAYNFRPHVDITLEMDFRLLALMISKGHLEQCVHGMNAQTMNDAHLMTEQFKALGNLDFDEYLYTFRCTTGNYKFLAYSSYFDPKNLMGEPIDFQPSATDDFPDHPIKNTNLGIPLDRPYKEQPEFVGMPLVPKEDIRNVRITLARLRESLDSAVVDMLSAKEEQDAEPQENKLTL